MLYRYIKYFSLIFIPFFILLSLGLWQIHRLQLKNDIMGKMNTNPIELPLVRLEHYEYYKVKTKGSFDVKKVLYLFGGKKGYYVLSPLHLIDGSYILVNLGTVSAQMSELPKPENITREVKGVLSCNQHKKIGWFFRNDLKNNIWFWFDISAMEEYLKLPLKTCIIWSEEDLSFLGIKPNYKLKIMNNHLEYAITWFALAIIWLIISYRFLANYLNRVLSKS